MPVAGDEAPLRHETCPPVPVSRMKSNPTVITFVLHSDTCQRMKDKVKEGRAAVRVAKL